MKRTIAIAAILLFLAASGFILLFGFVTESRMLPTSSFFIRSAELMTGKSADQTNSDFFLAQRLVDLILGTALPSAVGACVGIGSSLLVRIRWRDIWINLLLVMLLTSLLRWPLRPYDVIGAVLYLVGLASSRGFGDLLPNRLEDLATRLLQASASKHR
jgi:hypothetical protein